MNRTVFLSYHSFPRLMVETLASHLREAGVEVWLDVWNLSPSDDWALAMEKALQSSRSCLMFWGGGASRPHDDPELLAIQRRLEQERNFPIINILLPNSRRPADHAFPPWLKPYPWIECSNSLDDPAVLDRIVRAINTASPSPPRRLRIPDIAWIEIPAGPFIYGEDEQQKTISLDTFWIAQYPITNIQYQCFIDDDGYRNNRWWSGLQKPEPAKPTWQQSNRPRTDVDWDEAVAFTRWLATRLDLPMAAIRLPTEQEWEKAARGEQGWVYPWGAEYRSGFANTDETEKKAGEWYLQQPTAVGLYPQGQSPYGVEDLSGTVWEWCLNEYARPEATEFVPNDRSRVRRGGSWSVDPWSCRAASRRYYDPDGRGSGIGFRVCRVAPIE